MTGEGELLSSIRNGNNESFEVIVESYQTILLRVTMRFVKDLALAEDIVQETFIKAYESISKFEGRSSLKTWLVQIAINTAKNKLRSRVFENIENHSASLSVEPGIVENMAHKSVSDLMKILVDTLPPKQKLALVLRVYEDMTFQEIAEVMKCPYDTAKANYRHGLMKIREMYLTHPLRDRDQRNQNSLYEKEMAV